MKVLCLQIESSIEEDPGVRLNRVLRLLNAVPADTKLVILPEHWVSGAFNFLYDQEDMLDLYAKFLVEAQSIADQRGLHIHTGSGLHRDMFGHLQNMSFLLSPRTSSQAPYSKAHKFEQEFGEVVGGDALTTWNVLGSSISPLICYDLRFPESFRSKVNFGVEIFVIAAAWPLPRIQTWQHLLRSRAIENQAFVVGVNGVGKQQTEVLGGKSSVYGPDGELLAYSGDSEESLNVVLDLNVLRAHRNTFSFLKDAKLGSFHNLNEIQEELNCDNRME